jgi:hypothetical protein
MLKMQSGDLTEPVSVEFACVLKCLAIDLVVDAMVVVVVEGAIAEVAVVAAEEVVDTTEVLHATMIGIMTDHDRDLLNAVHHLHGHVQGAIHQDNVVRHIPKINIINNDDTGFI